MQMVILAGGLATRLRPLTDTIPKSLVVIHRKPFLQYQLELLRRHGITDIILCIGHLGDQIRGYFEDGWRFGVNIRYSQEGERLLGTAGAIKHAEPLLEDIFLLMNGDSFLMLDYRGIMDYFRGFRKLGLMVVYKNCDRYDRSNVVLEGKLVKVYDRKQRTPGMIYIDEGLSVLRKEALELIPEGETVPIEFLYQSLISRGDLLAYETSQRFYEIGSPEGLEEFRQLVASGGIQA
jgi:NDP-sugar pyrophosphorylase family protein